MKKIIAIFLILGMGVSLFALPPKIKRDQYMRGLSKEIKAKNYHEAENYFEKIDALVKEHKLKLSSSYTFFKAKTYLENKKYKEAYTYAEKYLDKTGSKGKFYSASLDVLDEAEKEIEKNPIFSIPGLMWQDEIYTEKERDAYDNYSNGKSQNWKGAQQYCRDLNYAEYTDWRLPSKSQFKSLYKSSLKNSSLFKNSTNKQYWSSTVDKSDSRGAWYYERDNLDEFDNLYNINENFDRDWKSRFNYVRCVRLEQ